MSQTIKKDDKKDEAAVAPTVPAQELNLSDYIFLSPEDEESLVDTILDPPEFNTALLRAKESYKRLFNKDI